MKKQELKTILFVAALIVATGAAMAYSDRLKGENLDLPVTAGKAGIVSVSGRLVQDRILVGGDGRVSLALNLQADEVVEPEGGERPGVDLVIVLDRSGSMAGEKLAYARRAVLNLLSELSGSDRFALVTYADGVTRHGGLSSLSGDHRRLLEAEINGLSASGSTNLAGGLQAGVDLLLSVPAAGNIRKIVLVSDGLANRGVTGPEALGNMAAAATDKELSISTVGVGAEFNEELMASIADRGAGKYHYLKDALDFAGVFQAVFHRARKAAASGVVVRVPLSDGIELTQAGGYLIETGAGEALVRPGDLLAGQTRQLYLTFRVPAGTERKWQVPSVSVSYRHGGILYTTPPCGPFMVACVKDEKAVGASIDRTVWEKKVLREDYSRLKEEVARDIRTGDEAGALGRIQKYVEVQQRVNQKVASPAVSENLQKDAQDLNRLVEETFRGRDEEVAGKRKANAKSLQYEGYRERRGE